MKPAPPVIMMFLISGRGSNFVVPVNTGASFQTPKSSKKFWREPCVPPIQYGQSIAPGLAQARWAASRITYRLRRHLYRSCEGPSFSTLSPEAISVPRFPNERKERNVRKKAHAQLCVCVYAAAACFWTPLGGYE